MVSLEGVKMAKKKSGRRKSPRSPGEICAARYSPIDVERICQMLGLIPMPENVTVPGLVELWNTNTDYQLPRHEDRGKDLRVLSKPLAEQSDERGMWVGLMREDHK